MTVGIIVINDATDQIMRLFFLLKIEGMFTYIFVYENNIM